MSVTVAQGLDGSISKNTRITEIDLDGSTTSPISDGDELALVQPDQEVRGIIADGDTATGQSTIPVKPVAIRVDVSADATVVNRTKTSLTVDELVVVDKAEEGTNAVDGDETVGGDEAITGDETANTNTP